MPNGNDIALYGGSRFTYKALVIGCSWRLVNKEGLNTMNIRSQELRRIIKEELEAVMNEANPYHSGRTGDKTGGRFTSKAKAKSYSLSQRAANDLSKNSKLKAPFRAKMDGGKIKGSPMGMNTSDKKACGRTKMPSGARKSPSHACSTYPERYNEAFDVLEEIAEALGTLQEGPDCTACLNNFVKRLRMSNLAIKQALDPKVNEHETYAGEKVSKADGKTASRRSSERKRKWRRQAGMEFDKSGFSSDEKKLLKPSSLYQ